MSPHWTPSELSSLRALYPVTNTADLVPVFRRTTLAIKRMAEKNGILKSDKFIGRWSDADNEALTALYPTTQVRELMARFNRSKFSVLSQAAKLGLQKSPEFLASGKSKRTRAPRMREVFLKAAADTFARPMGASLAEAVEATGVAKLNAKSFLCKAVRDRQLFTFGSGPFTRYFLTAEAAQAGGPLILAEALRRRIENKLLRRLKATEAARAARAAQPKIPKPAKPPVVKVAKVRAVKPPKSAAEPKLHPYRLERSTGPRVEVRRGPAYLEGDLIFTDKTRRVVYPRKPDPTFSNTHASWG